MSRDSRNPIWAPRSDTSKLRKPRDPTPVMMSPRSNGDSDADPGTDRALLKKASTIHDKMLSKFIDKEQSMSSKF